MRALSKTILVVATSMLAASSLLAGTITINPANPVAATEGMQLQNPSIFTFSDSDQDPAANFAATINWGDGTTSPGTTVSNSPGQYSIGGTHTYADEGNYALMLSLQDSDGSMATKSGSAGVADAQLSGAGSGPLSFTPGVLGNPIVGTFTDPSPETLVDYFVSIDWGDGSTSAGTIVTLSTGNFSVSGSHVYNNAGDFTITTTARDDGGSLTIFSTSADVGAPVPEPASLLLTLTGLMSIPIAVRRRSGPQ